MRPRTGLIVVGVAAFLLGASLPAIIIWNPARWAWADRIAGRSDARAESYPAAKAERKVKYWRAPMDANYISDKPGKSPMGMDLIPVYEDEQPAPVPTEKKVERKVKYWRAPMDPNYISDKPGKSPMGMDLIPVYEDEASVYSGIRVDPSFLQNFAVRTVAAERGSVPIEVRTVGILQYDQKNIVSVNTKFEGWIEKARVNYIGETVHKGDVLFEVYSPQLVTTQEEYLAGLNYVAKLEAGGEADAVRRARSLLEASRERLRYWDITDAQIEELERSDTIRRSLEVVSPASGVVIEKMGESLEGMKLTPGMNVYRVADLSTIWAGIEVFESQIQYVRLGRIARISLDAFPGKYWTGTIIYIDPAVDQRTRTLKAYMEIPNPDSSLRPAMYANVELSIPKVASAVRIPEEAVLHTGERSVVIVETGKGVFEPREVELGALGGGYREVRKGLGPGEMVVTSSQFLIDSESNLKEAINKILASRQGGSDGGRESVVPPGR